VEKTLPANAGGGKSFATKDAQRVCLRFADSSFPAIIQLFSGDSAKKIGQQRPNGKN
jgi:hypothetical protein